MVEVLGQRNANLAVAESGQAAVLAAIAELNGRRPVVVAVPTTADAERLAGDLVGDARRGCRPVPSVGDTAVRADQPRCGDNGAAVRSHLAAPRDR